MTCPAKGCDRPVHLGWTICKPCAVTLERDLAEIPALQHQLDLQLARIKGRVSATASRSRSANSPLPYDQRASEQAAALRDTLVTWVRELEPAAAPHPTTPAMAHWLLARVAQLYVHPAGGDAVSAVRCAVERAWRCIDHPTEWALFGMCTCGAELRAPMGQPTVRCRECGTERSQSELHDELLAKLDGHLVTAIEFSAYAVRYLGYPAVKELQLRNRIAVWTNRGRVSPHGHVARGHAAPRPLYRFGELMAKLNEAS